MMIEGVSLVQVNSADADGVTALAVAAAAGHETMVASLLAVGAATDLRTRSGVTALMFAAINGHAAIVEAVLEKEYWDALDFDDKEMSLDFQDDDGLTALMHSVVGGHAGIADLLLEKDAQLNLCDAQGVPCRRGRRGHFHICHPLLRGSVWKVARQS